MAVGDSIRVMLRFPTWTALDIETQQWWIWLERQVDPRIIDADVLVNTMGPAEARNVCVGQFLSSDCTHLWMIDQDLVPPQNLSLLDVGTTSVLCGIYPGWHPQRGAYYQVYLPSDNKPHAWQVWPHWQWPAPEKGEQTFLAPAAGTGCMLIERSILVDMDTPFYYSRDPSGRRIGEDFTFCSRLGGVEVMPSYRCDHMRPMSLAQVQAMWEALLKERPREA